MTVLGFPLLKSLHFRQWPGFRNLDQSFHQLIAKKYNKILILPYLDDHVKKWFYQHTWK